MKKLMIIAAVVCAAIASHAAAFNWKTSATGKVYEAGTTTLLGTATAYLFDSAAVTQQTVLDAFASGSALSGYLDSSAISSGAIAAKADTFSWGAAGQTLSAYFAVVNGDEIFISGIASGAADAVSTTTLSFNAKSASQAAGFQDTTFAGAGWYTAAVPEPTSGLLLLLGMAGLALKRKHA